MTSYISVERTSPLFTTFVYVVHQLCCPVIFFLPLRWRWALCAGFWWWRSSVLCRSSSSTSAAAPATPPRGAPSCLSLRSCPPPCWSTSALSYTSSPTSSTTGSSTSTPMLVVYTNIKKHQLFLFYIHPEKCTQKFPNHWIPRSNVSRCKLD